MDTTSIQIETKNLLLKTNSLEYKNAIFTEFTPDIAKYMFPKSPEKIEETIEFIETAMKENREGKSFQIVVLKKDNGEFLGCGGVNHLDTKMPELGIWLKKSAHGHGYGKEAMVACKEWLDKNVQYEYIVYPVVTINHPSRRIPEFLDGKPFREFDNVNKSGVNLHLVEYRIYPTK